MSVIDAEAAVLVVPDGWLVDELGQARMRRLLAKLPDEVAGVATTVGPLPPGSSYRAHAEQLARRPLVPGAPITGAFAGAALLRHGVAFEHTDDGIVVAGTVLLDEGSHAFDPWAEPPAELEPADALGRSPFSRRPTVVFLQTAADSEDDLGDWARRLANGLLRRDVEARLALHEVSPGLHLTRPSAPVEATIEALQPDVIVTLDAGATEMAPHWCRASRSTVLVELAADPATTIELLAWRIGVDRGRWRARVGQAVDVGPLARLVNRLCSGPQPVPPPREGAATPAAVSIRRATPPAATLAIVSSGGAPPSDRVAAFAAHAAASGLVVDQTASPTEAEAADIVMVDASTDPDVGIDLVERRRARDRSTIVDVGSGDLDGRIGRLLEVRPVATAPSRDLSAALRAREVRAQLLPTLLTPAELVRLDAARVLDPLEPPRTIGVVTAPNDVRHDLPTEVRERFLAAHPELSLTLPRHDRIRPEELSSWRAVVWLHGAAATNSIGRPRVVVESTLLGLPAVFATAGAPDVVDALLLRHAVEDATSPAAWFDALEGLLDPNAPTRRRVSGRADALFGRKASSSLCRRVVGWAQHRQGAP